MATKRNPLFIKYEKLAGLIRKNVKDFTDYNYTVPETHLEIKARFQLVREYITELNKILDTIKKEKPEIKVKRYDQLSAARPGTKPVRRTTKKPKLAERKNVVTFPDGFEFKKVSPAYAKKNYKTQMIYGLEPVKGIEGLIETVEDFKYWQNATNIFGKEY